LFFLQGVIRANGGSETTFNIDQSGAIITETGTIWNAPCSGNTNEFFNGGWGGDCTQVQINYPGTPCTSIAYGALPAQLVSFNASVNPSEEIIDIKWETSYEENISNFVLEHGIDGQSFMPLTTIAPNNNSTINKYSYQVTRPLGDLNYYRLKIVDYNGQTAFSKIDYATITNVKMNIVPNPSSGTFVIENTSKIAEKIEIFSIEGRSVFQGVVNKKGVLNIEIEHPGIYFLKRRSDETFTEKIIVQH